MAIMTRATSGAVLFLAIAPVAEAAVRRAALVPDKLIVLTFDDSAKSHAAYVAPRLKELGFGATFFITEGFDFPTNKTGYMTWEEIAGLHKMGFEIGNHTAKHANAAEQTREALTADLELIERRCAEHGLPRPVSFAYPGNGIGGIVVEDCAFALRVGNRHTRFGDIDKERFIGLNTEVAVDENDYFRGSGPWWKTQKAFSSFVVIVGKAVCRTVARSVRKAHSESRSERQRNAKLHICGPDVALGGRYVVD